MTTPLPHPDRARLDRPGPAEVQAMTDGVLSAIRPRSGPTEFQTLLIGAAFEAMTEHPVTTNDRPTVSAADFGAGMADRNEAFRTRILQTIILGALVLRPLPLEVAERINVFAREMSVEAVAAGSVGPWEPGGISEYQYRTAAEAAAAAGARHDPHGATP